ncbi:hypothetical protein N9R15_00850 [Flavobacteriaceae bacterium]|nr:hypothetical protein [Flavobacteriaceae bacterium]
MMKQIFASLLIMVSLISCDKDDNNIITPETSVPTVKLNATYEVNITEDITYAEGLSHDSWNSANNSVVPLLMDSYVPDNDLQKTPFTNVNSWWSILWWFKTTGRISEYGKLLRF